MKRTPVTLRDVAGHAGVHPGTVSRALNPATRAMVNERTARRVLAAATELGYRPNPLARALKTTRSGTVGVLLPDLTNPLFPPIVRGIEDVLESVGMSALLANTDNDAERERQQFESMQARQVDGFILATARRHDDLVAEAIVAGVPMVLVNRSVEGKKVPAVIVDDLEGLRLAVGHLAGLGHQHIAHLGGPEELSTGIGRRRGFFAAMEECGLKVDRKLVVAADAFTEIAGEKAARRLFDSGRRFTAVVAANDLLALGCYDVLADRGLTCPRDISVVGYNDMPFVGRLDPGLTTVRIPHYALGAEAARLLLDRLENPTSMIKSLLLAPELVVRASTSAPGR